MISRHDKGEIEVAPNRFRIDDVCVMRAFHSAISACVATRWIACREKRSTAIHKREEKKNHGATRAHTLQSCAADMCLPAYLSIPICLRTYRTN